jgi:L-cysteine/cystine lyase
VDSDWLADARRQIPALRAWHYFNTGTAGAMAHATADAMGRAFFEEMYHGRIRPEAWEESGHAQNECRERLGRLFHVPAETLALTHHTTEGMNLALLGTTALGPGDEVLMTSLEHAGAVAPARLTELRRGVSIRTVDVGEGGAGTVGAVTAAFTEKTRLLVVSHVAYGTGAVLEVGALVEAAHRRGIEVAVDGAQSVGAIPVNLSELQPDYYAFPAQKWLMGPEGLGGLYVRPDRLLTTLPVMAGAMSYGVGDDLYPDARRFQVSSIFRPGPVGLAASLAWLEEDIGYDRIFARTREVTASLRAIIAGIPGARIATPPDSASGLLVFGVEGRPAADIVQDAGARRILIRTVPGDRVRVSGAWYLGDEDLDAFSQFARSLA